jgi:putative ABC transport system substrate-binding protein
MNRRSAIAALGAVGAWARNIRVSAEEGKIWHVGFINGGPRPPSGAVPLALREALASLGYREGTNVSYTGRWAEVRFDRLPQVAAELVQAKVDVIVATGWVAANAAKRATHTIPIVVANAGDAVESHLVDTLSRPGGNVTGISDVEAVLSSKRLQILKEAVPNASRLAVLWNQEDVAMTVRYRQIESAARELHVAVQALGVREPDDFAVAFSAMLRQPPQAMFLVTDALTNLNRKRVIEFAAQHHIPAMYENSTYARDGGLMSYGPDFEDNLRRAAYYVDRILKGGTPSDTPMEQPTRFYFVINMKTARSLGITIPQAVLVRADEVIQ